MGSCLAQDSTDSLDLSKIWKSLNVFKYEIWRNRNGNDLTISSETTESQVCEEVAYFAHLVKQKAFHSSVLHIYSRRISAGSAHVHIHYEPKRWTHLLIQCFLLNFTTSTSFAASAV